MTSLAAAPLLSRLPSAPQAPLAEARFHEWLLPDGTVWTAFHRDASGYRLRFPGHADFTVSRDGRRIAVHAVPGVSDQTVEHLYLNQVLPLALSRQGRLVFHGSAVEIEGAAAVFLGASGRGKSTLAAAFARAGFRFLADDGVLVDEGAQGYRVVPGHASLRLWDDSGAALVAPDARAAPALAYTAKCRFLAGSGIPHCGEPRPLRRLYFLGDGSAGKIAFERIAPAAALIELVKHSFLLDIEERETLAAHFGELSRLAQPPYCHRLDYPRRYEDLARLMEEIAAHAAVQ